MQIIKKYKTTCKAFDTEKPDFISDAERPMELGKALHRNIDTTVLVFLRRYFPPEHPVFDDFGESFYYVGSQNDDFDGVVSRLEDALFSEYMRPADTRP